MSSELRLLWEQAGGRLPDDWKIVPFESLLRDAKSIVVGVMYPGPHSPGGTPLVKVGDVKDGVVNLPTYCISPETDDEYRRSRLEGDELLITLVGNPGECVVVTPEMRGWNPARAIAVVRLRDTSLRTYLKAVLESAAGRHLIDSVLNTTVQKTLNLKDIRRLPIPIPAPTEILAISKLSEIVSARLSLLRETNATLEAIAQALFKAWFIDFDPVRAKMEGRIPDGMDEETAALFPDGFEESELVQIPIGWVEIAVSDAAEVIKGKSYSSKDLVERHDVALVTLKSFERGGGFRMDGFKPYSGTFKQAQIVKSGDLIVAYTDVTQAAELIGKPALVVGVEEYSTLVASLDVGIVRPNVAVCGRQFLYGLFKTDAFQAHTLAHTSGTTVLHLSKDGVGTFKFRCPPISLVEKFESIANALAKRRQLNVDKLRTLINLRDTLLPRLISGQLRIPEAAADIEAPETV
jgi:type I restriction enzyme S subunit